MKLNEEVKNYLAKQFFDRNGDCIWLHTVKMATDVIENFDNKDKIVELINVLIKMNSIVVDTEDRYYVSKYEGQVKDIYDKMLLDLFKLLEIKLEDY